jgi:glycosyltransferase involved in cell wall biosynthesis
MAGTSWGGSEELWSQAALRLREEGHEVSASVVWWPQLSPKVTGLAEKGVKVVTQAHPYPRLPVMLWRRMKKKLGMATPEKVWLRSQQADLVIISQGFTQDGVEWMNFCQETGLPYASIVQCNSEIWWPSDDTSNEMQKVYSNARKVFCVSRHNLELLEDQVGESLSNAEVVWNPFNVPADQPPVWPKENGAWKMACVARLDPVAKGQDLLLRVLSQTKWRGRALEVNFYGTGPCHQGLKKLANRLQVKNVHFRGHVTDVRKIWEENHLLVMPSRYEGLPLALIEAMWCARPSVVTNAGGNAEICVDGETGFVAAAPAVELLDQALENAWNRVNDWEKMGNLARARVERLIPKDPIGNFCQQLKKCVKSAN